MVNKEYEVVLITGGLGGIGAEIVKKYSEDKFKVIIIDIAPNTIKLPDNWRYINANVTSIEDIKRVVDDVEQNEGFVNHIVSVAGMALGGELFNDFALVDLQTISNSIDLNLKSHLYLIRLFIDLMKKNTRKNKSITIISSVNALSSFGLAAYSASKSGIYGVVKSMCTEFGRSNIRINAVSPGTVPTPRTETENKDFDKLLNTTTLNKFATTKDVANVVWMLTNEVFSITGQNIVVDAGQTTKAAEVNK
jgi:3-oxoacyl-[acyl-carrier protein] reductase